MSFRININPVFASALRAPQQQKDRRLLVEQARLSAEIEHRIRECLASIGPMTKETPSLLINRKSKRKPYV